MTGQYGDEHWFSQYTLSFDESGKYTKTVKSFKIDGFTKHGPYPKTYHGTLGSTPTYWAFKRTFKSPFSDREMEIITKVEKQSGRLFAPNGNLIGTCR